VSALAKPRPMPRDETYYRLRGIAEDFLFEEAEFLDARNYWAWLETLSDDLTYVMPIKRNVKSGEHALRENTREGVDINWFEEDKWTLTKRAEQIMTGVHWAEEPLSRVCHMVSNIQLIGIRSNAEAPAELDVRSRFLVYQNRVEHEAYFFVGKRSDTLRLEATVWRLLRRYIELDQNVLLAKNLTVFF
jgi:3-phenylpropionate/cinnamic acid dioxygenase small subunit